MSEYKLTVGLEVHAELSTKSKMFCGCKNDPDEKNPNVNICPVCMGYPGTLPVINKEAVRQVLRLGSAVNGKIADYTEFDRKNYFYPDIPKGYQISQYKYPLVSGGALNGVTLTRVHLEEDTARSSHDSKEGSLVDFNRAGVPLMELVTEPVMHSAEEVAKFARELQLLLWYLGASEANMEKGEMRVEANISVSKGDELGTKVEVKNLNSFKAVEKAIRYEFERHTELLEKGEKIKQETRGWDENKEMTFSQRSKEDSHDYRYFPDPDLPKLFISEIDEFSKDELKKSLPELPDEKRNRYKKESDANREVIEAVVGNKFIYPFVDAVLKGAPNEDVAKTSINLIASSVLGMHSTNTPVPINPSEFINLSEVVVSGNISSTAARVVVGDLYQMNKPAQEIIIEKGLLQKNNKEELINIVKKVIEENKKVVEEYKSGNQNSLQYLIGQGMKVSKGSANPQILKEILEEKLR